jgi:ElaB/YqjD/DUF883 family membrane-anchored ribosome-binding protein
MANTPKHSTQGQGTVEQAKDVASQATQQARAAADNVTERAQDLAQRAADAACNLSQKAEDTMASVGGQMKSLAGTIRGSLPQEGMVGSAASAVAETLESGGSYLQEQHLIDMADDLAGVIRRHPLTSVLVGVGIGFMLARTLRSL